MSVRQASREATSGKPLWILKAPTMYGIVGPVAKRGFLTIRIQAGLMTTLLSIEKAHDLREPLPRVHPRID